ncbi:MAG: DUF3852 domain-containing protein [Oscillospiraceae bacterium]|nr:DUF3852 domain-containing protein [Oscillospiraceae bacterium]
MKQVKKLLIPALFSSLIFANVSSLSVYAAGDIASAVSGTWTTAREQVESIVNTVVFPVLDVILAILLFVKIGALYLDYRKHGQIEWTPIAIIFGGLLFTLTAPMYIWTII